ncbi:serine hydrolase domain-containing protein [Ornithinimicrobium murale]|uniref:serine hydrolase domain-containing protein n=1 Tax=Ornithinimicrobium murale TaxID=1050153 RepID=UPI0013B35794|nr:serine hydrolase domain-containing protein [Ornithinimicrobium murale]
MTAADLDRVSAELTRALQPLVQAGTPPGLTWGFDVGGERRTGALGHLDPERTVPARLDTIYRISSMTKPVTAVATLSLVEDGVLSLDQPVDELLPELADRRVLTRPDGPLEQTEPAHRPITVEDLLTFRLGHGMDFTMLGVPTPLDQRLSELGLVVGPPAPQHHLPPDAWLAALGSVPLRHQPGERWLYNTGAEVLGVLLARCSDAALGDVLRERVLDPLGMPDTAFSVPAQSLARLGACFAAAGPESERQPPEPERLEVYDPPDGQWSSPPTFEGGDGGLVSTVEDFLSFGAVLRDGRHRDNERILSADSVTAMTSNQLTDAQLRASGPSPDGSAGWGLGVGVTLEGSTPTVVGSYGWDGGLGSTWRNDTARDLVAVLLTNQSWASPVPPAVAETFWSTLATCLPLGR